MRQIQTSDLRRPNHLFRKPRALIVEDDMTHFMYLSALLREHDYHVTVINDGSELMATLSKQSYDIVFLDIILPKVSGFDALALMRSDPVYASLPVIVTSSRVMQDLFEQLPHKTVQAFLPKPIDEVVLDRLLAHIEEIHDEPQ